MKISYGDHHDFLLRHGLSACSRVLDVGTGNGAFVARLAHDHPQIQYVGIDKRKYCIESCKTLASKNLEFSLVDMFARTSPFDFSTFEGFLMRYFLLHVDHSKKILELFKEKAKRPSKFWIIDLDYSRSHCEPRHRTFDKLTALVSEFCSKKSIDSLAGKRIVPMLKDLGFQNISEESIPFSSASINVEDLARYIKQEVLCYSIMSGRSLSDPETNEIVRFIDEEVKRGEYQISYGMILVSAEL